MDSDTLIEQPPPAINLSASTIHRAVERVDAKDFREQIIRLFESNGNFQFAQRFDWYYRDRSQPAPISFVLRDKNLRVFGLCSVNLRDLRFGKIAVRAGVAGNLVVDRSIGAYLAP